MKKWNLLITANDGKPFYQNFHVVEADAKAAARYLGENFPEGRLRATVKVTGVELMEDAAYFLPGIVFKSGKAYFRGGSAVR